MRLFGKARVRIDPRSGMYVMTSRRARSLETIDSRPLLMVRKGAAVRDRREPSPCIGSGDATNFSVGPPL